MQTDSHFLKTPPLVELQPAFLVLVFASHVREAEPVLATLEAARFDVLLTLSVEDGLDLLVAERFDAIVAVGNGSRTAIEFLNAASVQAPGAHRFLVAPLLTMADIVAPPVTAVVAPDRVQELVTALRRTLSAAAQSQRKFVFDRPLHR